MISGWDEAETERADLGHLGGAWTDVGRATGSKRMGLSRIQVDAARWSTPAPLLDE